MTMPNWANKRQHSGIRRNTQTNAGQLGKYEERGNIRREQRAGHAQASSNFCEENLDKKAGHMILCMWPRACIVWDAHALVALPRLAEQVAILHLKDVERNSSSWIENQAEGKESKLAGMGLWVQGRIENQAEGKVSSPSWQ